MPESAVRAAKEEAHAPAGYECVLFRRAPRSHQLSLLFSLGLHLVPLLYLQLPLWAPKAKAAEPEKQVVRLVLPFEAERAKTPPAEAPPPKLPLPAAPAEVPAIVAEEPPLQRSVPTPDELQVDVASATLIYQDPNHELPIILSRYRGFIGFGRANERDAYVRRVFSADMRQDVLPPGEVKAVDEFCFMHIEGGGYPVVDELRRRHGLENHVAYACFNSVFPEEVSHTIRKAVARNGGGKVKSATIVISAAAPNGLVAAEIVLAKGAR